MGVLLLALTFACSGGGGSSNQPVSTAPSITAQPADRIVTAGQTASFTVAASGNPAPTFQWERSTDGTTWVAIGGAVQATYTFTTVRADDGALFRVKAANSGGVATSSAAVLTVQWAPSFPSQPASQAVTAPATANFTVTVEANPAATLQWQSSTDGTTWGDLPSATGTSYTTGATSISDSGIQFRCVATNALTSTNSDAAVLTVNIPLSAPAFTLHPQSLTKMEGQSANFTVAASGNPVPSFIWEKSANGGSTWIAIPGATGTTYSFTAVATDNGGQFRAKASNGIGAPVTSNVATLTVDSPIFILPDGVTLDMIYIPAGSFTMGSDG